MLWLGLLSPFMFLGASAQGQEAFRMSLASAEAAEARQKAMELGYCNLKMGTVTARIEAAMGFEYLDNVHYNAQNPQGDLVFRPGLNIKALIPITELNSLYFSSGIGFMKYLRYSDLDSFYVTPDSALSFVIYSGNFAINLHDRFALTENGSQMPTINSVNNLGRLENTAGVGVDWDLNKLILSAGYDHNTWSYTSKEFQYMDRTSELISTRAAFELNRTTIAGLEVGGGLTSYDGKKFSDKTHYSAGPFIEAKLTPYITTTLSAGYTGYTFDSGRTVADTTGVDSFYARWSVNQRLTRTFRHSVVLEHRIQPGSYYELEDLYTAGYRFFWDLMPHLTLNAGLNYQQGWAYFPDRKVDINWFGADIGLNYQLTRKTQLSATYQFGKRDSSESTFGYAQNRLALSLTYTF